ncbi:MAG: oligoendopeptidase F [Clostridia bacterium]|nr:oligoendopeptidase F [Clostridia bacterium]
MSENYEWNLKEIFPNKEELNQTKQSMEQDLEKLKAYQGKLCETSENLYEAYSLYEKALEKFDKLYAYGMLFYHLDMSNQEGIKQYKEVEALGTTFRTATAFMTPEITYEKREKIENYLKQNKKLQRYQRNIQDILDEKEHILSKEEENLLAHYSELFSAPENTFDILTNTEFKFGTLIDGEGKEVELTDSNYSIYLKNPNSKVRKQVFDLMYQKYSEFINTIAELYLSNVKASTVSAKLRKYHSSLEKAVMEDDASIKVYQTLIETIHENIEVNHKFVALKKKMLGIKDFHMYDLYVNPLEVEQDKITFEEAKKEVVDALKVMGTEYTSKLTEAFEHNWVDAYAKPNKKGGAYSMSVYGVHPYVLMNFVNSKRDVSTLAHELGHSIHSYYSNSNQTVIDANYTIMTAEVASTVNEILLSNYQIGKETDTKKKAELLYELLEMIRATLFRQSMFAEFEKIVHEKIENGQTLSSEDLNNIYYDLNQKYFGNNIIIDQEIQYEWARIPHFYSDFYVYKYATGISAAIAIATKILDQGEPFVNRYLEMLKQGCSKKSIELLKMVDVDLEEKEVYQSAINFYQEKIEELEKLI